MEEIPIRRSPISLALVNVGIVRIHRSPVDAKTVHIRMNLVNAGTVRIQGSYNNVKTVHIHESMLTGVRIPQKSDGPRNAAMDTMSCTLCRAARSPFTDNIERAPLPSRFMHPPFNFYDEKTDPKEHINHYIQMMSLHAHNVALMCKVFPSSLGPTILRWFNGLQKGSIHSFAKLIQEFGVQFVTCSQVPQSVDALLSMKMRVRETLCSYAGQYWELYNEIGGGNEKIMASTFRMGLPEDTELRESLTRKPPEEMRQLMRHIEEYKRLEDDWL